MSLDGFLGSGSGTGHDAYEALIDLFISFVPAPGQEVFCDRSLSAALRERITALKQYFVLISSGTDVAATSAKEILKHLNEEAE
ncbi:MAG: hypothetical protein V4675_20165 [Verrucomicrobiota bacterium]